jgi:transketolase
MYQLARACGRYLVEKGAQDPSIWVLDGDLADSNGAEEFVLKNPNFIQAGIAEQNMISVAAGLATTQCRPWVFSFAAFLCYRGYDQIRTCISQTALPVALIGSHAGACTGRNGKSHASLNDISLMVTLPNMSVWAPADANDVCYAVDAISAGTLPAYMRCPRDPQPMLGGISAPVRWIGEPSEIAIFSYGLSTQWAVSVQNELRKYHRDIGVLHFSKVWPFDQELLRHQTAKVKLAYVLEDHYPIGGLSSCLYGQQLKLEIVSMGWPLNWHSQSGSAQDLLRHHSLDCEAVAKKMMSAFSR